MQHDWYLACLSPIVKDPKVPPECGRGRAVYSAQADGSVRAWASDARWCYWKRKASVGADGLKMKIICIDCGMVDVVEELKRESGLVVEEDDEPTPEEEDSDAESEEEEEDTDEDEEHRASRPPGPSLR